MKIRSPCLGLPSLAHSLPRGQRPGRAPSPHEVGTSLGSGPLCSGQGSERVHDLPKGPLQPGAALTQDLLLPPIPRFSIPLSPQTSV